jgi:DNA-binding NarL/FixJ family response regulator
MEFIIEKQKEVKPLEVLTAREKEIADFLIDGKNIQEIAEILCRSQQTIEKHRKNIYRRLDVHSQIELLKFYLK